MDSNVEQALLRARKFLLAAAQRSQAAKRTDDGAAEWRAVRGLLNQAIGELYDAHVSLPPDRQPDEPSQDQLDAARFEDAVAITAEAIKTAVSLDKARMKKLEAENEAAGDHTADAEAAAADDLDALSSDGLDFAHTSVVEVLRQLHTLCAVAEHHEKT